VSFDPKRSISSENLNRLLMVTCSPIFTHAEPESLVADDDRGSGDNAFRQQIIGRRLV
jgi:hypothetical protein